jgi:hypothetical protein
MKAHGGKDQVSVSSYLPFAQVYQPLLMQTDYPNGIMPLSDFPVLVPEHPPEKSNPFDDSDSDDDTPSSITSSSPSSSEDELYSNAMAATLPKPLAPSLPYAGGGGVVSGLERRVPPPPPSRSTKPT